MKKIAVIGGGISGIVAAESLAEIYDVTLFEKDTRIGGHADTETIEVDGKQISVDTGFIVFNPDNYPTFMELIKKYNVPYKDSDMSFAVSDRVSGLEYNATSIGQLFTQKKNIFSFKFYRMIFEIFKFYKNAPSLLNDETEISLSDYLTKEGYSNYFITNHIIPMTCALWSGDTKTIMNFPAKYLVSFMHNHKMLQAFNRPVWKTIDGGSKEYISRVLSKKKFALSNGSEVVSVRREEKITVVTKDSERQFDKVVFCCHSDQVLKILDKPSLDETNILGAIAYQKNEIILHTDSSVLPQSEKAWASWNVLIDGRSSEQCRVSYCMNLLQGIECEKPIVVSLNQSDLISSEKILAQKEYHHPVYNQATIRAQKNRGLIQGKNNSYFCGAYWGWGFHEDGARSAKEAVKALLEDLGHE